MLQSVSTAGVRVADRFSTTVSVAGSRSTTSSSRRPSAWWTSQRASSGLCTSVGSNPSGNTKRNRSTAPCSTPSDTVACSRSLAAVTSSTSTLRATITRWRRNSRLFSDMTSDVGSRGNNSSNRVTPAGSSTSRRTTLAPLLISTFPGTVSRNCEAGADGTRKVSDCWAADVSSGVTMSSVKRKRPFPVTNNTACPCSLRPIAASRSSNRAARSPTPLSSSGIACSPSANTSRSRTPSRRARLSSIVAS